MKKKWWTDILFKFWAKIFSNTMVNNNNNIVPANKSEQFCATWLLYSARLMLTLALELRREEETCVVEHELCAHARSWTNKFLAAIVSEAVRSYTGGCSSNSLPVLSFSLSLSWHLFLFLLMNWGLLHLITFVITLYLTFNWKSIIQLN